MDKVNPHAVASMEAISRAVRDGDRESVSALVATALTAGKAPLEILSEGLTRGIRELGSSFKEGHAFLPEILIGVRAMDTGLEVLRPLLEPGAAATKGKVLLGTVEGDLHDIGKRLVAMLLRGNGFAVVDLGVDVSAPQFVAATAQHQPDIVALSALLTTTTPEFRHIIEALIQSGLRRSVSVMVGGAPVSKSLADEVGADGFAEDCVSAVDEAERLVSRGVGR